MNTEKKYLHFELVRILREETDPEHPMSQAELTRRLGVNRSTVSRALGDLLEDSEHSRVCSVHVDRELDEEGNEINTNKRSYHGKVYYRHEFSNAELRFLMDGILFSRHVPATDRDAIIEKLLMLGNKQFRKTRSMTGVRRLANDEPMNEALFYNIDTISRAIENGRKISTVYGYIGPDFTFEPAIGGRTQILNPYAMVARNGYYFLICNNDRHNDLTHYRIDRMTQVKIVEDTVKPIRELDGFNGGFDLQEYMSHNINMAFGDSIRITFIAHPKAVREIIDAFGKSVEFTQRDDGCLDCVVRVPEYDMERWVLQWGDLVTVTGPDSLLRKLKCHAEILAEKYAGAK